MIIFKITDSMLFSVDLSEKEYEFEIYKLNNLLYKGDTVSIPNTTRCMIDVSSLIKDDFDANYGLDVEGLQIRKISLNNSNLLIDNKNLTLADDEFSITTKDRSNLIQEYTIVFNSNSKSKSIDFRVVYKAEGDNILGDNTSSLGVNYICSKMVIPYISENKINVSVTDINGVIKSFEDTGYTKQGCRISYLGYLNGTVSNISIGNLNLTPTNYLPEYIIYYKNSIGGIDWMFFNSSSTSEISVERNTVNLDSFKYSFNEDGSVNSVKENADDVLINNSYNKTIDLKSILITRGLYNRLTGIIKSNKVWIASSYNNYEIENCIITDKSLTTKNSRADKLVQMSLKVKLDKKILL